MYEGKRFAGKRVKQLFLGTFHFFFLGGGVAVLEIVKLFGQDTSWVKH